MPDPPPRRGFRSVVGTVVLGLFTALGLLATVAVVTDVYLRRASLWRGLSSRGAPVPPTGYETSASIRTRTEALEESRFEILDRRRDEPLESGTVSFTVPADAPPTSEGERAVRWKLHLAGEIGYWPDVAEEYELRVLPFAGSETDRPPEAAG